MYRYQQTKLSSLLNAKSHCSNFSCCTPATCGNFSDDIVMRVACLEGYTHTQYTEKCLLHSDP